MGFDFNPEDRMYEALAGRLDIDLSIVDLNNFEEHLSF